MSLRYKHLSSKPHVFLRLTGLQVYEFEKIMKKMQPLWEKKIVSQKKSHVRNEKLKGLEDKLLSLFIYYRT